MKQLDAVKGQPGKYHFDELIWQMVSLYPVEILNLFNMLLHLHAIQRGEAGSYKNTAINKIYNVTPELEKIFTDLNRSYKVARLLSLKINNGESAKCFITSLCSTTFII